MKKGSATTLMLAAALASGAAAAGLTHWYIDTEIAAYKNQLDRELAPVNVVVAMSDIPAGSPLTHRAVAVRPVPGAFVSQDAVMPDQFESVAGQLLSIPVGKGEPILYPYISQRSGKPFSDRITPGHRALTFQVDEVSSQSGMIAPDDRVDLLVTLSDHGDSTTFRLLENVPIMATGNVLDSTAGTTPEHRFRTVTLIVDPEEAARITHARATGKLTLVVRSPGDHGETRYGRVTKQSLLGHAEPANRRHPVEVILGGR